MSQKDDMLYGRCHMIKEWNDWDNEIHNDQNQINRQGYAMTYPFTFTIDSTSQTARFSGTVYPYYDTTLTTCTCDDFQERQLPCKHIYRLAVELNIIEIIKRNSFDAEKLNEIRQSSDIDNHPEQLKRQKSAMSTKCTPATVDYENKTAVFNGSGKKPYLVTFDSCTCRDFFVRRLPCKHIYRLRYELEHHQHDL